MHGMPYESSSRVKIEIPGSQRKPLQAIGKPLAVPLVNGRQSPSSGAGQRR